MPASRLPSASWRSFLTCVSNLPSKDPIRNTRIKATRLLPLELGHPDPILINERRQKMPSGAPRPEHSPTPQLLSLRRNQTMKTDITTIQKTVPHEVPATFEMVKAQVLPRTTDLLWWDLEDDRSLRFGKRNHQSRPLYLARLFDTRNNGNGCYFPSLPR